MIQSFGSDRLVWFNNPTQWGVDDVTGELEGSGGSFAFEDDCAILKLSPPACKDFWARTFYTPLLIKNDASGLLCAIAADEECTLCVDFEYTAVTQFDQAGILVYLDDRHWVKAGIEFCDGSPRLSVVVCNVFSDWSTQPWSGTSARLRIHKVLQSSSIVVEAAPIGTDLFQFIRIAHVSSRATHLGDELTSDEVNGSPSESAWRMGPFAACPVAQKGCCATFSNFKIGPREESVHDSDLSHSVTGGKAS